MTMYGKDYQEFRVLAEVEININPKLLFNTQSLLDTINTKYKTKYLREYAALYLQSELVVEYGFWS